jgi:hypothetical protein
LQFLPEKTVIGYVVREAHSNCLPETAVELGVATPWSLMCKISLYALLDVAVDVAIAATVVVGMCSEKEKSLCLGILFRQELSMAFPFLYQMMLTTRGMGRNRSTVIEQEPVSAMQKLYEAEREKIPNALLVHACCRKGLYGKPFCACVLPRNIKF